MENKIKDISKLEKKYLLKDLSEQDLEFLRDSKINCYTSYITENSDLDIEKYIFTDKEVLKEELLKDYNLKELIDSRRHYQEDFYSPEQQGEPLNLERAANYFTNIFDIENHLEVYFNIEKNVENIKQIDLEEYINKDLVVETSLENTKKIKDFIDEYLDNKKQNKDLNSILEDDLTQAKNRREVLLSRGINKIDATEISFEEKNKQIEALNELSLDQLENRYGKKSEELEALTNNSISKVANIFVKTYKGNTKDALKVADSYEEFIEKKAPKIIDEQVENSDIFKSYKEKMSKYVRENNNTDSPFMKLLNHYINLPNQILEKQFKDVLKEELKQEMLSKKDVILQKIQKNFEDKSKKKSKGMER